MSTKRRLVTLQRNGAPSSPRTVALPDSEEQCRELIGSLWGDEQYRLFLDDGTELANSDSIRDKDTLYVSSAEDFIMRPPAADEWVTLNVGGTSFTTSRKTLTMGEPQSMLARMFSQEHSLFLPSNRDRHGAYLIDRSPRYFEPLLHYLRCGQLVFDQGLNPEGVLGEARFFGIESLIPMLEQLVQEGRECRDERPLTRRDVIDSLIRSSNSEMLRFQGVNLAGADLSKLDLRAINFKYANMQGCNLAGANLSGCCLERADLSHATLDSAQLSGIKGLRAIMEGASMRNCNFTDPMRHGANLEGVNLKGACLEDSDLGEANLRIANCRNANLKNCNLRAAVLAGADLENCDLSGSDLFEANLRGANLKDAAFELMQTPLHMSQTIR